MNNKTFIYVAGGIILLIVLFYFVKPNTKVVAPTNTGTSTEQGSNTPPPPGASIKTITLTIKDKKLQSDKNIFTVTDGDEVKMVITSDEDEEVHVHGYDRAIELKKDVPGELHFAANLTGRFPFELEKSGTELGILEVQPK